MVNKLIHYFSCFLILLISQLSFVKTALSDDEEKKEITSGKCEEFTLQDIPVGDWQPPVTFPQTPYNLEQHYNTSKDEGFWYKGSYYYGHAGTDSDGASEKEGVNDILSTQDCIVIVSHSEDDASGWGEEIICATRINQFSEEIITFHYGHMHADNENGYETTRQYNACEPVSRGYELGKEGNTGFSSGSHLHFGMRLWKSFSSLKAAVEAGGGSIHGTSYSFGDDTKLETNLNPESYLFNYFLDYNLPPGEPEYAYFWSKPYALKMRQYGFYMGDWRGNFGAQTPALRREVARWLKIAAERPGVTPLTATFDDVEQKDPDSPYIEALTSYPAGVPVVNPDHTCDPAGHNFCPDNEINRAEALKMVVLAFYHNLYLKVYEDDVWNIPKNLALQNVMLYEDVSPYDWYASYVYFGTTIGLVENQQYFNPDQPVMKEEMAKWIITSYELAHGVSSDPCAQKVCATGQYCDPDTVQCVDEPTCVPSETQECEVGGGYIPDECDGNQNPVCTPGESKSQTCGNGGTQNAVCTSQCMWSDWGECLNQGTCTPGQTQPCGDCGQMTCQSDYTWSTCQGQGICTPGETQSQTCNGAGTQTQTCLSTCAWSAWSACSVQTECAPGQTQTQNCTVGGQPGTQSRTCDAYGQWGTWSSCQSSCECSSGICCDGCYYRSSSYECDSWNEYRCEGTAPGDDAEYMQVSKYCSGNSSYCNGTTDQTPWYTLEFCSGDQQCVISGTTPTCEDLATCTDTYYPSGKTACFDQNPNGVEICLSIQRVSGSSYQFRVCKTGTFQNNFSYEIKDILNPSHSPVYTGSGSSGVSCTGWKTVNFSYIPGYGTSDGATIRADVKSPADTGTLYRSAIINIYKQCL